VYAVLGKPTVQLDAESIEQIVAEGNQWRESRLVEYKRQLPDKTPDSITKFLKAISSFANTDGGAVFFGIEAADGVPISAPGLGSFNEDADLLRLQTLLRAHLDPSLTLVIPRVIRRPAANPVLLFDVPRSLLAPHAVSFNDLGQYWGRATAGKYLMPTSDLRQAFLQADAWEEQARQFHEARLRLLEAGRLGVGFNVTEPALLLHVLPLGRLRSRVTFGDGWHDLVLPDFGLSYKWVWNLDGGLVIGSGDNHEVAIEYFRNGGTEMAVTLAPYAVSERVLLGAKLQEDITGWVRQFVEWSQSVGREAPYVVFVSLVRVANYRLRPSGNLPLGAPLRFGFDRPIVQLPETVLAQMPVDVGDSLGEIFEIMWQAAGWKSQP